MYIYTMCQRFLGVVVLTSLLGLSLKALATEKVWTDEEETADFWIKESKEELKIAIQAQNLNKNVAKNVIFFLGDGMGMPTVTAGRILKGQLQGSLGEEHFLTIDEFQHVGISRTYSIDKQTPDSAATATAFLCGVKSMDATIGMQGKARRGDCESGKGNEVKSVLIDAYEAGKATGIVSTTQLTHATVATPYAHSVDRDWYSDADMPQKAQAEGCVDIASQFLNQSEKITVALGGGRTYFRSKTIQDETGTGSGRRNDGRDLIQEWLSASPNAESRKYVWNRTQLMNADVESTDRLWGMFQPKHMSYELDRNKADEPSLSEMVAKAIEILRKNDNGYLLIVEGGRIDHGHHDSSAILALHDMVAFDDAVKKAVDMTSDQDTIIIVTADHGHTMSIGGYADRGTSVFGLAPQMSIELIEKPATTILYGDGPGYLGHGTLAAIEDDPNASLIRENLTNVDTGSRSYQQQSAVPRRWDSHTAEDVAIYARGPMAHLFHGVHQQSYIAHVMRFVSCIGEEKDHCEDHGDGESKEVAVAFMGNDLTMAAALEVALYMGFVLLVLFASCLVFLMIILKSKVYK